MDPVLLIILLAIAGPLIGSLIGVMKRPSDKMMFNMLAFAAGVMLSISFLRLVPESIALSSAWICVAGIIVGSVVMFAVDRLIPHIHPAMCSDEQGRKLEKTAILLIIGIFLHNFPEGMAMGIGSVSGFSVSLAIALALAIHDVPEGICTSAPFYYITKKRLKSFVVSFSTAIPTVAGFLFAYFIFPEIPLVLVGFLIAATAGLMVYISSDELIPTSCCRATGHSTIFSLILGVLSVILLGTI